MKLKIKTKPLSSNASYRGRRFSTKALKAYQDEVWLELRGVDGRVGGFVQVHYKFYIKYYWRVDEDNMVKPLQDILVNNDIIDDDRFVIRHTSEKIAIPKGKDDYIEVEIKNISNATTKLWEKERPIKK